MMDDDDDDIYESRKKDFVKFFPFLSFFLGKKIDRASRACDV